jgi:hypothetical protein
LRAKWVECRIRVLLPVPYFHVVFTLPQELNAFALRNKKTFYSIFFQAISETLTTLGQDAKYLGAQVGFIAILHTWGQNLIDHPHIHCVVPGGGLIGNNKWKHLKKDLLFPIQPMSVLFKGKMLDYFKSALQNKTIQLHGTLKQYENPETLKTLIDSLYESQWIVYAKPPFAGPKAVFKYLSRYTHRIAISNNRIVSVADDSVTFSWKDYADGNKRKNMTLPITEFIRRFMLHVIPTGFVRIRHFGFLSNRFRKAKLHQCLYLLVVLPQLDARIETKTPEKRHDAGMDLSKSDSTLCPLCKKGHMKTIREIPRGATPPTDQIGLEIAA